MNKYELTVILRNSDLESLQGKVKSILEKHGCTIVNEDNWGHRKLAYEIDGVNEGFYLFMNVEMSPDSIQNIIKDFRLNRDILRYLFVKQKAVKSA